MSAQGYRTRVTTADLCARHLGQHIDFGEGPGYTLLEVKSWGYGESTTVRIQVCSMADGLHEGLSFDPGIVVELTP